MYHDVGLKILNLDFTIFRCSIFYPIILIVLCSVNHLKSGKVYRGYSFLAKFFEMAACPNVNSFDFEMEENDQINSEKHRPLILRA